MRRLDEQIFGSWPLLTGFAAVFGLLFAVVMMLSEALFSGELEAGSRVFATGCIAMAGFLFVAGRVRSRMKMEQETGPPDTPSSRDGS